MCQNTIFFHLKKQIFISSVSASSLALRHEITVKEHDKTILEKKYLQCILSE